MDALLLPGMHGTAALFDAFAAALPPELAPRTVEYPTDRALGYGELFVALPLPAEPFVVVAESFSGPLGIRLAHAYPDRVRALVLVATFARAPAKALLALGAVLGRAAFAVTPPSFALRALMTGRDSPTALVAALRREIARNAPAVLARRLSAIRDVDESAHLAASRVPTLYLAAARDRLVAPRTADALLALRPDLRIERIDSPHLVLQRCPTESASLIASFVRGLRSPTTSSS